MPNTKISDDPSASTLAGTELLPIVQGGNNKKVTVDTMLTDRSVVQYNPTTQEYSVGGASINGIPSYNWADIPDPAVVAINSRINIPAAQFPHTSIPRGGLDLKADGVVWQRNSPGETFAYEWGLDSVGVSTIAAGNLSEQAFTLAGGVPTFLPGMLYVGMCFRIRALFKSVEGNGSAAFGLHFGALGSLLDPIVAFSTAPSATADRDSCIDSLVEVVSSTKVQTSPFTAYNNSGQTNAVQDQTITSGPLISHKFTLSVDPSHLSDSFRLTGFRITLL